MGDAKSQVANKAAFFVAFWAKVCPSSWTSGAAGKSSNERQWNCVPRISRISIILCELRVAMTRLVMVPVKYHDWPHGEGGIVFFGNKPGVRPSHNRKRERESSMMRFYSVLRSVMPAM